VVILAGFEGKVDDYEDDFDGRFPLWLTVA